ncbi:MAG TPA: hypothetical protein PKM41_07935 [Deltaproteobacteria bacterium]|jgi:hypothetical protein|nr:hypothetical protein [Deltaproteobacteria bacterium]HOI07094.1 hypothetical protein [Deltaproteobacteria bacterium]
MAGASDISAILSQAGRIEKVNQNPFVQSEVARQILTEDEARQRIRKNKEVNESGKVQQVAPKERERSRQRAQRRGRQGGEQKENTEEESRETGKKHIIDVVV